MFIEHLYFLFLHFVSIFRCWETKEKSFFSYCQIRNNCGNSGDGRAGNTSLYHKGCCHGDKTVDSDYLSPMTRAINESIEGGKKKKRQLSRSDTLHNIERSYNTAKREEKKFGESFRLSL
mgnify:CR=1 FL=1